MPIYTESGEPVDAGRLGIAVTFVDWEDLTRWGNINQALELGVPEPVETYSSSEHLYTDLDIPAGTKGRTGNAPAKKVEPKAKPKQEKTAKPSDRKPRNRVRVYKKD